MKCKHPYEVIHCICDVCGKDISDEFKKMQKKIDELETDLKIVRQDGYEEGYFEGWKEGAGVNE